MKVEVLLNGTTKIVLIPENEIEIVELNQNKDESTKH